MQIEFYLIGTSRLAPRGGAPVAINMKKLMRLLGLVREEGPYDNCVFKYLHGTSGHALREGALVETDM